MDILQKIASVKRNEVKRRKITHPLGDLKRSSFFKRHVPSFHEALAKPGPSVIAEFKRKSPTLGDINPGADIRKVSLGYQDAGVAVVSVLTDSEFFGGNNSDLTEAAELLSIPVLRKDFIVDEYQVIEAKSIGAGAILLIASILSKKEVDILSDLAVDLGMDILFEIHDITDLEKMNQNIKIVGVNNRNLRTFEVSIDNSIELLRHLPEDCLKVAESGLRRYEDVNRLFVEGYNAFLIGETFMRSEDPGQSAGLFIRNLKPVTQ